MSDTIEITCHNDHSGADLKGSYKITERLAVYDPDINSAKFVQVMNIKIGDKLLGSNNQWYRVTDISGHTKPKDLLEMKLWRDVCSN